MLLVIMCNIHTTQANDTKCFSQEKQSVASTCFFFPDSVIVRAELISKVLFQEDIVHVNCTYMYNVM